MGARMVKYAAITRDEIAARMPDIYPSTPMKRIGGRVKDWNGKPAPDAVLRLYKGKFNPGLEFIRQVFTDNCGEFDFGLVRSDIDYTLKVWYKGAKVKKLILAKQEKCHDDYEDFEDCGCYHEDDEEE
ncbi:carboxypeptidase-like regulatory domain-containing protein [Clostridium thermarum]|uniref:carboxypeptidase-like regulatory domain-containing protein n=1 Tax=Clostridium thermarum TaxID=1716543 RepID=UPI00111DC385|nr:carboxypeptidase-like regulatory domain-containing protein [Clostridium thermarum]